MIWNGGDSMELEDGEPVFRSCWECNGAHDHLRKVNRIHVCFLCERYFLFGRFLDEVVDTEDKAAIQFEAFCRSFGMEPGDSSTDVDLGYRLMTVAVQGGEVGVHEHAPGTRGKN